MKFLPIAVAFVSFCLITFHANPAFAAVIDAGAPPEDAVVVPLEVKESDDATAAAASVIDATPEEAASIPRRRRKLGTKKTGAMLNAQVASSKNGSSGGCPGGLTRDPSLDYKCSSDQIFCLGDECTANECRYPLDPCYLYPNEKACKAYHCYWYPHGNDGGVGGVGMCSSSTGVSCGNHHATGCDQCRFYDTVDHGKHYCHGDCEWKHEYTPWSYCGLV